MALRATLAQLPASIYRAKGTLHIAEVPGKRFIMHLVGSRCEILPDRAWGQDTPHTQLVCIGKRGALARAPFKLMDSPQGPLAYGPGAGGHGAG